MDNEEIWVLSRNSEFQKRIGSSIAKAAAAISGEDPAPYTQIWVDKRHKLATSVINSNGTYTKTFSINSAAQSGLNSVITINVDGSLQYTGVGTLDADIDFTVISLWDDVAGVSYDDKQP